MPCSISNRGADRSNYRNLLLKRGAKPGSLHTDTGRPVIFRSIERGDPEILKSLLDSGADHACRFGTNRDTPFLLAVRQGILSCVETLIKVADISAVDEAERNALSIAIVHGHTMIARTLLRVTEISIGCVDNEGMTPLHHAAREGYDELVDILFAEKRVDAFCVDSSGLSPLKYGVLRGHYRFVATLLQEPAVKRRLRDSSDRSLLCWAIERDDIAGVEALLDFDLIDPNWQDEEGYSPLHRAVMGNEWLPKASYCEQRFNGVPSTQVLQLLLDRDVNVNAVDRDGWTALMHACNMGPYWLCADEWTQDDFDENRGKRVQLLLAAPGVDVNVVSKGGKHGGETAVAKAVRQDDFSHFDLLLSSGASLNVPNELGMTAVHKIALWNQYSEIGLLERRVIEHPTADLECRDRLGRTPIFFAAIHGDSSLFARLGASVNTTDHEGWFPAHYSAVCPYPEDPNLGGGRINRKGPFGLTPFHMALRMDWREFGYGAQQWMDFKELDVNSKDDFGNTPIDQAAKQAVRLEKVYGRESVCLMNCRDTLGLLLKHPNIDAQWVCKTVDEIVARWKVLLSDGSASSAEDLIVQQCADRLKELTMYKTLDSRYSYGKLWPL